MELTNFTDADLRGAVLSASVAIEANLYQADLTNARLFSGKLNGSRYE